MVRTWLKLVLLPAALLVGYFTVPVNARNAPVGVAGGMLLTALVLAAVAVVVTVEARRAQRRLAGWHLALILELTLITFAFAYYVVAQNAGRQFEGLDTRIDALYFSVTTTTTVGFGDVHAVGQLARCLVLGQMVFNLTFLATLAHLVRTTLTERPRARPGGPDEPIRQS